MRNSKLLGGLLAAGMFFGSAQAADFTVELTDTGGASEITATIQFEDVPPSVSSFAVDISYPTGWTPDVTNCPQNEPSNINIASCTETMAGNVRFVFTDLDNADATPTGQYGQIVFSNVTETFDEATLLPLVSADPVSGNVFEVGGTPNDSALNTSVVVITGPAPNLAVSGNGDFGNVVVGDSSQRTFTVTNDGDAGTSLEITGITVSNNTGGDFTQSGGSCTVGTTLATGAECTVIGEFTPAAAGGSTGNLNVSADNGDSVDTALTGNGTAAQPVFVTSSNSLNLVGEQAGATVNGSFSASNTGPAATRVEITGCSVTADPSGTAAFTPASATLNGGDSQTFTLSAEAPAIGAPYSVEVQCSVESFDSDGNSLATTTLTITADVSTRPAIIPTLGTIGLVIFSLLMGLIGLVVVRQRA